MRPHALFALGMLLCRFLSAHDLTPAETDRLETMNAEYARDPQTATFDHAWLLYRTGHAPNYAQADDILNRLIALQDQDPESLTYGQWGWRWEDGEKRADLNAALFKADILFAKLWDCQSKMCPETQSHFRAACNAVLEAAKRRWETEIFDIGRDFSSYSNIFVLYIETFTLAGERFNDPRLKKIAQSQWTRWYNHVSFFGIDEFASPTYNHVIFSHLLNIHRFSHDDRVQRESKEVLDLVYLLQSAITHPLLKLPVSGISRDYRNFLTQPDARSAVLTAPVVGYTPPQEARGMNENRSYPFEAAGKASIMPFLFKSYQLPNAAMGSMTGGNCFQQQIHCMAAAGNNERERAVLFLQGSNTPVNGFTDQKALTALCVYNRLPTYWHFTQWRGDMTRYRDTFGEFGLGVSAQWREISRTPQRIILGAYGFEAHIFPFALENNRLTACDLSLKRRTTTSPRYHPRPRVFEEYTFPENPDWFGVYIALTPAGEAVPDPGIVFSKQDDILVFQTSAGHQIRAVVTSKGDTRQLFNTDPALIPTLTFTGMGD